MNGGDMDYQHADLLTALAHHKRWSQHDREVAAAECARLGVDEFRFATQAVGCYLQGKRVMDLGGGRLWYADGYQPENAVLSGDGLWTLPLSQAKPNMGELHRVSDAEPHPQCQQCFTHHPVGVECY